jgi:AcrR family transcriptional regulator
MTSETAPRRSDATRAAILAAARERFAADGYERATIRAIAADARIDPSMVMRYYGNKEKLFAAAAEFDLRLPDLTAMPRDTVGARLAGHLVDRWEHDETLMALLRAAVTNPAAAERMRELFAAQLGPTVAALNTGNPAEVPLRAGLLATQALGFALTRYVLRFPPVVAMDRETVVAWIGPTLQRYLTGDPQ